MQPTGRLAGVRGVTLADDEQHDLAALYAASYPRLVAVVGAIARSRSDAEEAVQDAFVRLVVEWPKVSLYDDPEAWVRRVALGFLSNRRRKVRNFLRALSRLGVPPDVPPPDGNGVDVARALDRLPRGQREALVLFQTGLSVEQIARELDVAPGTVKARLSRGRAALAEQLRDYEEVRRG